MNDVIETTCTVVASTGDVPTHLELRLFASRSKTHVETTDVFPDTEDGLQTAKIDGTLATLMAPRQWQVVRVYERSGQEELLFGRERPTGAVVAAPPERTER